MRHLAIVAVLLSSLSPALADATWTRAGWYRVEIFPSLKLQAGPFAGPKSCKKTLPKVEDDIVRCARVAKAGGEVDVALAHFAAAIKANPRDASSMNYRGLLFARRGEYDKAIAEHNAAMKANPDDFWAYVFRGKIYAKLGRKKEAEADFRSALAYNPGNEETVTMIKGELRALGAEP